MLWLSHVGPVRMSACTMSEWPTLSFGCRWLRRKRQIHFKFVSLDYKVNLKPLRAALGIKLSIH